MEKQESYTPKKSNHSINKNTPEKDLITNISTQKINNQNESDIFSPSPVKKTLYYLDDNISTINTNKSDNIYSSYVKRRNTNSKNTDIIIKKFNINDQYKTSHKKSIKKLISPNIMKSDALSDRFIPLNKGINLMEKFNLTTKFEEKDENKNINSPPKEGVNKKFIYEEYLKNNIFNIKNEDNLIDKLTINNKINIDKYSYNNNTRLFSWKIDENYNKKNFLLNAFNIQKKNENLINSKNYNFYNFPRKKNIKPYKELSVPNIIDDYYLNLLDWSSKDQIAVGNSTSVFLWNISKTQYEILMKYSTPNNNYLSQNYITSLIFSEDGEKIAVGNFYGYVELYDINKKN